VEGLGGLKLPIIGLCGFSEKKKVGGERRKVIKELHKG